MSNVEIYDSSNSQLSSDEYSNDEDDDALMDVAVSKQQTSTKSDPKSTESSSSAKAHNATTTPRKLSDDMDAIAGGSTKPPASREVTQRQIKQLQRNNQANLYFKQRSIKWLQRLNRKTNYSAELKAVLPAREAHAKRMMKRRTKKNMRMLAEIVRRSERTPSRSRTHSGSASGSEVVCLDDTENEDSPDKVTETATAARQFAQSVQDLVVKNANSPYNLKLELGAEATAVAAAAASAENNILDEFLTMKPIKAAETIVQQNIVINDITKSSEEQIPFQIIVEPAACNLQMPVEEVTNKRRRSISPPTVEPNSEKRTKPIVTDDFDDDIIEFLPVKQPTPPTAAPIPTTPVHKATVATFKPNTETPNTPAFKLGSPYTLTPSGGMDFYAPKKSPSQQQQQSAVSYSLDTPTPPVEPMEIVYPTAKPTPPQRESLKTANEAITFATPHPIQPQQLQQYQQQQPSVDWQKPRPKKIMGQTPAVPAPAAPTAGASAATATATPQTRNKSHPTELNNSNSNASFHQRIKDTYQEFDGIMTEKVNNITPELLALRQEEIKNNADMDTLNNLLSQKEEEWNRLQHLLCVKKELAKRIERKTRILVINEVLPSILNRNCSSADLHNLEALMYKEKNAPMPLRFGSTAIEKLIENVANDQDDIGLLMGFLGVPDRYKAYLETPKPKPPPPPQSHYAPQLNRRNSVPAMRPTMPPPAVERRHNDYHWDHHHAEREVESQPTRRSRPQPPQSKYQQLINESKELINSSTDLSASSSYRSRQQQQPPPPPHPMLDTERKHTNSMDNHLDNETSPKPLYNSSPLGSSKPINQRNDIHPQFNDLHSNYRSGDNHNTNRINRFARSNGPQELDPDCHHCGRPNADLLCVNCKNIWYCSRECQLRAWDVEHWQTCTN